MKKCLVLVFIFILLIPVFAEEQGVRMGYVLGYSVHPLNASGIAARFQDLPALGHFSSFFAEFPLGSGFAWLVSPGAANFEPDGRTQFNFQDNLVGLDYKTDGAWFTTAGVGLGGAIATLTTKVLATEGVTDAVILRSSAFLWSGWAGLGWRWDDRWELSVQARAMGLFHEEFSRLNALYGALSISYRL